MNDVSTQVKLPSLGLMLATGLSLSVWAYILIKDVSKDEPALFSLVVDSIVIVAHLIIGWGAYQLSKCGKYWQAMAGLILALIPVLSPCCFLGVLFSAWGLVVMHRPEVREVFD